VLLDCVIYCAFYSILFRGAFFSGHGVHFYTNFMKEKSALPEVARIIGVGGCLLISPQYSTGIKLKKTQIYSISKSNTYATNCAGHIMHYKTAQSTDSSMEI